MFKIGERGSGFRPRAGDVQDFEVLRDQCLQRGALFEDPDFDTVDSSLFYTKSLDKQFEWKRPSVSINIYIFFIGFNRCYSEVKIINFFIGNCKQPTVVY